MYVCTYVCISLSLSLYIYIYIYIFVSRKLLQAEGVYPPLVLRVHEDEASDQRLSGS